MFAERRCPHRCFINLPFTCKEVVYQNYVEYFNRHDPLRFTQSPPQVSYFYGVWKHFTSDVKRLKSTGFEKCAECVFYNQEKAKNILNPVVLRHLKEAAKQHYEDTAAERRGYELRKQLSCLDPQHYLSLVVDGADQYWTSNYGLSHHIEKSKDDRGHKLAVKLVGVLIHGVENDLYLFSMMEGFETGANHIIESLHRALDSKKKKIGKLPPVLFVQSDDCTRENKNRYFLSYLEKLVARGVFVEAQLSSMEVGHSHTDIDQSFSCVHKRLDKYRALSLKELHCQLGKSYALSPHLEELSRIANYSAHCDSGGYLAATSRFSQYRYFRILRQSNFTDTGLYKIKCTVKRNQKTGRSSEEAILGGF